MSVKNIWRFRTYSRRARQVLFSVLLSRLILALDRNPCLLVQASAIIVGWLVVSWGVFGQLVDYQLVD